MTTYREIAVEKAGEWFVCKMENAGIHELYLKQGTYFG